MTLDILGVLDQLQSHAASSGFFDGPIGTHEPKNPPGNGLSCAIWVQALDPVPTLSGLAITAGRIEFNVRLYSSMLQEPQDAIDPNLITAVSGLFEAYGGDFELGGIAECVDLLGQAGAPLSAKAGYQNIDGHTYRVIQIIVPVLINDIWEQDA